MVLLALNLQTPLTGVPMIYNMERNLLIYTPPKCASTMLHNTLCKQNDWIYVMGPQFDDCHIEKHTHCVPFPMKQQPDDATRILMWRDPYERALSLYGHYLHWWRVDVPFRYFLEKVVHPGVYEFLSATVYDFEQRCQMLPTHYVKVGDWDKLRELGVPLPIDLRRVNTSDKRGAVYDDWCRDFVAYWMKKDFDYT